MSLNYYEEEDINKESSIDNFYYLFTEYEQKPPSLYEALFHMFKSCCSDEDIDKLTLDIIERCKNKIDEKRFKEIKKIYSNILLEDAYIICSYSCESSYNGKYSPYRILNSNLVSGNRRLGISNISKYLYILLKSLRKLKLNSYNYLYRCISKHVLIEDKDSTNKKIIPYEKGKTKIFWGFTSTSPNIKTSYTFLKKEENKDNKEKIENKEIRENKENKKIRENKENKENNENKGIKSGTIFTLIGDVWGYDISLFNYYNEEEILLEPERKYIVEEIKPKINDLIFITCNIQKSPLVLSGKTLYNINEEIKYKYLCKIEMEIKIDNKEKFISGLGILCNLRFKNMKAFITYNHVINFDFLNNEKKLEYTNFNGEKREINMKINRFKYTYKDLDITIIEILDTEENEGNYLEIDDFINSKDYKDEEIYFIGYDKKDYFYSQGKIKGKKNNFFIFNDISLGGGGFLILKKNSKLIGIIKENETNNDKKYIPMDILLNKINFIKCIYEIKIEDIGKEIQLINNGEEKIEKNNEIKGNLKLIINGEYKSLEELKKKFIKEGFYIIYIVAENLLKNMSYMFRECFCLKEIDLSRFNSSNITDISNIFFGCSRLNKINFSLFNTNNIINMSKMFYGCSKIEELNLTFMNTNKVTDMSFMFCECSGLKELNLSSFNTSKVRNMSYMFFGCCGLKELNLSKFNTSNVNNMSHMFPKCSGLKKLNLISFDTSKVTNMSHMLYDCSGLNELNLSSFDTNQVNDISYMFYGCSGLKELNLSNFKTKNISNFSYMFYGCSGLKELNLSSFTTDKANNLSNLFCGCSELETIDLSSFNAKKVTDMSYMFYQCSGLKELNLSSFCTNQLTNMKGIFSECTEITKINLAKFNTKKVVDMSYMFYKCYKLKSLNLVSFNTSQVTNISYIFCKCSELKELNLSSFILNNVTDISNMFSECNKLIELNLSSFGINVVTNMSKLFYNCSSLTNLDLSSFNTKNVRNMSWIFSGCSKLKEIKLKSFDTSQVSYAT